MQVKDWKGNEIKAGDTIVYIHIRRDVPEWGIFAFGHYHPMVPTGYSLRIWEPGKEYLIEKIGDKLGYYFEETTAGFCIKFTAFLDDENVFWGAKPADGCIIAIKGVSDHNDIMECTSDLIARAMGRQGGAIP